jgi:hypothetical protein
VRRALLLAAGLALAACGPDLIELRLQGRVSDEVTGTPISGASVLLTWARGSHDLEAVGTVTGPDGRYRLFMSKFPCDGPALTAGSGVYDAQTRDVPCSESEQVIDFELSR